MGQGRFRAVRTRKALVNQLTSVARIAQVSALVSRSLMATHAESGSGLPPSGYGCHKPNSGFARFWPFGLPSSTLWPRGPARSACARSLSCKNQERRRRDSCILETLLVSLALLLMLQVKTGLTSETFGALVWLQTYEVFAPTA